MQQSSLKPHNDYLTKEHAFAQYIRILGKGKKGSKSLTLQQSFDAFQMILNHQALDEQVGAFMMLLRVKEEDVNELIGFVKAVRHHLLQTQGDYLKQNIDLDWPTYAGKRKHHTWYLLSAKVLALHGIKIAMHGASGHTLHRIYTQDMLSVLQIPVVNDLSQMQTVMHEHNICYLPLESLQPKLADIVNMRNIFGLRSPVHSLVKLINPFDAPFSIQSIFHPAYQAKHLWTARALGYQNSVVIKGDGGEFERNPDARTKVMGLVDGSPYEMKLLMLNAKKSPIEDDLTPNYLLQVWQGKHEHHYGVQAITETLALLLITLKKAVSYHQAVSMANDMWHARHETCL